MAKKTVVAKTAPLSGIVTFLSDFGHLDTYVGEVKGALLSRAPRATIVDLTHDIPPFDIERGAFSLLRAYSHFPAGTIHLAVVDPGVGSTRDCVWVKSRDFQFIGPDNGVLLWAVRDCERREGKKAQAFRIPVGELEAHTFHGRDVFAPFITTLLRKRSPKVNGLTDLVGRAFPEPTHDTLRCVGEVLCADRFGNLVTTIPVSHWPNAKEAWLLDIDGDIGRFSSYSAIPPGKLGLVAGSHGFWELAANQKSAAQLSKASPGQKVILR